MTGVGTTGTRLQHTHTVAHSADVRFRAAADAVSGSLWPGVCARMRVLRLGINKNINRYRSPKKTQRSPSSCGT